MMTRGQKKQYLELEQSLTAKCCTKIRHNELVLTKDDFEDGKLSSVSFARLKDECWYIPYADEAVVKVPMDNQKDFMESMELYSYRELNKIRTERNENRVHSLIIFLIGLVILVTAFCIDYWLDIPILMEFLIIISWVFIWATVHKLFFDNKSLKEKRFTLLQLLSAKVVVVDKER